MSLEKNKKPTNCIPSTHGLDPEAGAGQAELDMQGAVTGGASTGSSLSS